MGQLIFDGPFSLLKEEYMKVLLGFALGLFFCGAAQAASLTAQAPIKGYGTPVTVSISSVTATKVPTSQTSGRMGIFLNNPATNSHAVTGFYGDCTSNSVANTIQPIYLQTSSSTASVYLSMREDVCLWLLSLKTNAATQDIHYQEVKQ